MAETQEQFPSSARMARMAETQSSFRRAPGMSANGGNAGASFVERQDGANGGNAEQFRRVPGMTRMAENAGAVSGERPGIARTRKPVAPRPGRRQRQGPGAGLPWTGCSRGFGPTGHRLPPTCLRARVDCALESFPTCRAAAANGLRCLGRIEARGLVQSQAIAARGRGARRCKPSSRDSAGTSAAATRSTRCVRPSLLSMRLPSRSP